MEHQNFIYTSIEPTITNIPNVPFVRPLFDVDEQMEHIS